MVRSRTVALAGTPSAILDTAGGGTHPSVGVVRAKETFAALTPVIAGIPARSMEFCQRSLEGGLASGIVGYDMDAPAHARGRSGRN
jgi:hypothetical protein